MVGGCHGLRALATPCLGDQGPGGVSGLGRKRSRKGWREEGPVDVPTREPELVVERGELRAAVYRIDFRAGLWTRLGKSVV